MQLAREWICAPSLLLPPGVRGARGQVQPDGGRCHRLSRPAWRPNSRPSRERRFTAGDGESSTTLWATGDALKASGRRPWSESRPVFLL